MSVGARANARSPWLARLAIFIAWSMAGIAFTLIVLGRGMDNFAAYEFSYHVTRAFLSLALAGWGLTGVIAGPWLTVKRTMIIATVIYAVAIGWFAIALHGVGANSEAAVENPDAATITPEQYPKALELSSRGCDAGDAKACGNLGFMYEHGYGVPIDYPRALSLYSKACDMRLPIGCRRLGFMYVFGRSVSPDVSKEKLLFSKGCDGGDEDACTALKGLSESAPDVH
jgi:hypothetical protein